MQSPGSFLPLVGIVCSTAMIITAMVLVARHLARRTSSAQSRLPDEDRLRLERIERTVEASAIEIERLSESNRFVAKLLSERVAGHLHERAASQD
jgi:hypothetical protein